MGKLQNTVVTFVKLTGADHQGRQCPKGPNNNVWSYGREASPVDINEDPRT